MKGFFSERAGLGKDEKEEKYAKRYIKNMNTLLNFMTSNYVGDLMKKYGYNAIIKAVLPLDKFDYKKFLVASAEKGYISLEEINDLKKAFEKNEI